MPDIIVFGSINMDLIAHVAHLPQAGETLIGRQFSTVPGGKGANQAVACARLGFATAIVGRVGGDSFGEALLLSLRENGVDISQVKVDQTLSSGIAMIAVDDKGENSIIVVSGANEQINNNDLKQLETLLPKAKLLLLQLEIPLPMVEAAAELAQAHNVMVVLDPAPAQPLPAALYPLVDILTPNETEAAILTGLPVHDQTTAEQAADRLLKRGAKQVIIKLGAQGAYSSDGHRSIFQPAYPVMAVDTVAAGDAFNGALAAALAQGVPLENALRWGCAGGALATTRPGAQPAMPQRSEIEALLES